jgi:4-amino-4-deoxy-L-arabinose transferase-like glycosyltransferase
VAENLVEYGTFGNRNSPTAYRPPLYPCVLAALVWLGPASRTGIGLLHLILGLGTVWLTYRLGQQCGLGRWAWLAAALVACDPILLAQSTLVMTETLAAFLAVAALGCLTLATERRTVPSALAAGVAAGLCALCRPTFLPWAMMVPFVLLAVVRKGSASLRETAGKPETEQRTCSGLVLALAFAAALATTLAPWAIRNQMQFGRPIVTTTHGGYTLLRANNPYFYEFLRAAPPGAVWDCQEFDRAWIAKVPHGQTDEVRADRLAFAEAIENIRKEPATFWYACLVRVGRFFGVVPHALSPEEGSLRRWLRWGVGLWYVVELALAVFGAAVVWLSARRGEISIIGWFGMLLLVACFTAAHSVYWTDMRMRAPLMPVIALAAAMGLGRVAGRVLCRNSSLPKGLGSPRSS